MRNSIYNIVSEYKGYSLMAYYGFKLALRCRWEASIRKEKFKVKDLNTKARYLLRLVLASDVIALTDKLQCLVFFLSSPLYRFVRVKSDPYMRLVERRWKFDTELQK